MENREILSNKDIFSLEKKNLYLKFTLFVK